MALRIRRVKTIFGYDKTKTEKYVVVPDRATVVNNEKICTLCTTFSGISVGIVQAVIQSLVQAMLTFIEEGHTVQLKGFGTFIPSFNAKSSLVEKEANVDSIHHRKIRFLPALELRAAMNKMQFVFDETDSTQDEKKASEEEAKEPENPDVV